MTAADRARSERPPLRDVLRIIYIRGGRGGRQVALVLECGHWITRRRPPVHLAKGLHCIGCVVERVLKEDAEQNLRATPIADLIERSSVGAGLHDIKERGIDAHLADLERETRSRK